MQYLTSMKYIKIAKNTEFLKRLSHCSHDLKGESGMNKIIKELNLPGGTTRPVVNMRKLNSSSTPVRKVEIQLEFDLLKEVDFNPADKKE